ncbi:hypothetical protein CC80DRAFT_494808 [Byssothecium circinans]|uniref:Uncharacterized protein n=1 Tax=Byssothecium circinans TaxID=147558 RepID=A0A6A5TN90_9PLEO|nr:hypothetical protein CC80DRAFT_494808 [Byssothecium circinans]
MPPNHLSSEIHLHQPRPHHHPSKSTLPTYIIYFITGNPGLIEYYRTFLTHLYGLLATPTSPFTSSAYPTFHVFGRSLSGFATNPVTRSNNNLTKPPPYALEEQINHSQEALERLVHDVRSNEGAKDVRVILMGHSVGAYILLELTRRLRKKAEELSTGEEGGEAVRIVGGVCLFPTVTHIAKSDSGRKSGWLLNLPPFAHYASLAAKTLTFALPTSFLTSLIRTVLRFPRDAADVTASFINSPHGVEQALHMARDEMLQITSDTWDTEIWGAAHASSHAHGHARPVLRFLFAKEDHWVADETRDELIRIRGRSVGSGKNIEGEESASEGEDSEVEEWKPVMEIDEEEGWQHGFCIRDSVPVAERVFGYVRDIVEVDRSVR